MISCIAIRKCMCQVLIIIYQQKLGLIIYSTDIILLSRALQNKINVTWMCVILLCSFGTWPHQSALIELLIRRDPFKRQEWIRKTRINTQKGRHNEKNTQKGTNRLTYQRLTWTQMETKGKSTNNKTGWRQNQEVKTRTLDLFTLIIIWD